MPTVTAASALPRMPDKNEGAPDLLADGPLRKLLLTRTLANELAADGIVVDGVAPGTIETEMGADYLAGDPIAEPS